MRRRTWLQAAGGGLALYLVGCKAGPDDGDGGGGPDAAGPDGPAGSSADAGGGDACTATVTLYDTHAVALYFDNTIGPLTGIITVDMIVADQPVDFVFWHGHGGLDHRFRLEPAHLRALRRHERVMVETTMVDSHAHMLFIDPLDPQYRVEGAIAETVLAC